MRKIKPFFSKRKQTTQNNQKACLDIVTTLNIMTTRINLLEQTLKEINEITERNQYGKPEVAFKLIQQKIKEVL